MDNPLRIWVQTRGYEVDYGFLGSAPEELWWRVYNRAIDSARPGAAVVSKNDSWRIYLTGIPSSRRDRVNTEIRYTLVLSGDASEPAAADSAMVILENWLTAVDGNTPMGPLSTVLDEQFGEETVVSLRSRDDEEAAAEAARRALDAVGRLAADQATDGDATGSGYRNSDPSGWIGDLHRAVPRAAWLARAAELLGGRPGRALVLNLVESREDLLDQPDLEIPDLEIPDGDSLAILLPNPSLRGLVPLYPKVAPMLSPSHQDRLWDNLSRQQKILALVGIAAVLGVIVWIVFTFT